MADLIMWVPVPVVDVVAVFDALPAAFYGYTDGWSR